MTVNAMEQTGFIFLVLDLISQESLNGEMIYLSFLSLNHNYPAVYKGTHIQRICEQFEQQLWTYLHEMVMKTEKQ